MQTGVPPGTVAGEARVAVTRDRADSPAAQCRSHGDLVGLAAARAQRTRRLDLPPRRAHIAVPGARAPII